MSNGSANSAGETRFILRPSMFGRLIDTILGVGQPSGQDSSLDTVTFNERPQFQAATGSWTAPIALISALAVFCCALAANASRAGENALPVFYLCLAVIMTASATRLVLPQPSRRERIAILLITALALFLVRMIREPLVFIDHDEYLHWTTAENILRHHRLFDANPMLPISPLYPGLEIVATALANLAQTSVFLVSRVLLVAARLFFVFALFLFMEQTTRSGRIASLAALGYMGGSTFVFFDTQFSYESLSLPLMSLALLLEPGSRFLTIPRYTQFALFGLTLAALACTHHMTSYGLVGLLALRTALEVVRIGPRAVPKLEWAALALAIAVPFLYSRAMGNPGSGYLGPVIQDGIFEVLQLLSAPGTRTLFTSDDGVVAPLYQRVTVILAVFLTCLGLAAGFFRSLAWGGMQFRQEKLRESRIRRALRWENSWIIVLTLITFGFPAAIIFRLTRSGWEIGNRIPPFAYLGVGLVLAVVAAGLIQRHSNSIGRAALSGVMLAIIVCGGVISAEGPRVLVPRQYQVSADAASIEPMGIDMARWVGEWLGPGNRFFADRVNRLLLSGFAHQTISTTLDTGMDAGLALISPTFGIPEKTMLKDSGIDYVMSDLRITTGMPVVGIYFDGGLADAMSFSPPEPSAMMKFDGVPGVSRIFDNGYQIIYDVRSINVPH